MGDATPSSSARSNGCMLKHPWVTTPSGSSMSAVLQRKNSMWPWSGWEKWKHVVNRVGYWADSFKKMVEFDVIDNFTVNEPTQWDENGENV